MERIAVTKDSFARRWGFSDASALCSASTMLIGQNGLAWLLADAPNGDYLAWSEERNELSGRLFKNYDDAKTYVCNAWRLAWGKGYWAASAN